MRSLPGAAFIFFFGGGGVLFVTLGIYYLVRYHQYGNFGTLLAMAVVPAACLSYFRFGYSVAIDNDVIVHGGLRQKSKKSVARRQVAAVKWVTKGRYTFGQPVDENGAVLTSFDPMFPRKRVKQVAEFLAVPFK